MSFQISISPLKRKTGTTSVILIVPVDCLPLPDYRGLVSYSPFDFYDNEFIILFFISAELPFRTIHIMRLITSGVNKIFSSTFTPFLSDIGSLGEGRWEQSGFRKCDRLSFYKRNRFSHPFPQSTLHTVRPHRCMLALPLRQ